MPRKHIQSAKTNNSIWPGMLIWLTIVPQHLCGKQAVKDWMMAPRAVPAYIHFKHLSGGKIKKIQDISQIHTPPWSSLQMYYWQLWKEKRSYWQMLILTYLVSPSWCMHSSARHAQQHVSAPSCLRQKDHLNGAGGAPKMTWHWSQCYCLWSFFFFTQTHNFSFK